MKRFHVHLAVQSLDASIAFYSRLFGQAPAKQRDDYAKWMLDDPGLNFAISSRGHAAGLNHFGFQVDSSEELAGLKRLAQAAAGAAQVLDQDAAACCYARSEKHWTLDPQGLAWEHFHTLDDAPEFGQDGADQSGACCIPLRASADDGPQARGQCCLPRSAVAPTQGACCG
ncbi:catechol 2,3-dioxygenase-like lactoylglutathione lyase family enzyme [Paucibacter oligotrophus]|uniref:Catechol 2,3-dioxygenase-like lactoylglutathione lyase family enzyme n=1 Tax=Roseateles oligotrophus TaxID=1769250 RepID=A0A840LFM5_9BURK|nr:ArsI/CadI family heavy metal resistance metalloenzyme [Roseateles oligotrophus]MBB4844839.1 catechol 2,3-dioxygenase-like lactoylglutathione lyase family enzyme [Roseateles oligotrophus]